MKTIPMRLMKAFLGMVLTLCSISFVHTESFGQPIIVDHTCTDLSQVPDDWINQAKSQLRICYGHTSHGSQPVTGMDVLMHADPTSHRYDFNTDGAVEPGVLSLEDYVPDGDLGHEGDTSWADRTRTHLDGPGSDRNVVVWSWCGGVSDNTEAGIAAYLSAMDDLEKDYPGVTFVYMTGHLDGTGTTGNLHIRNNQIRAYCIAHHKVLFDFADIESYNPDGVYFLDQGADDACNYNDGLSNWAQEWCASHAGSALCRDCGYVDCCAHSEPLNCNLKGRAFWWLMARIAGWPGPDPCVNDPVRIVHPTPVYYPTLQAAYNAAAAGDLIQCRAVAFKEPMDFNRNISVVIEGGYDCDYAARSGAFTLSGPLTIRNGQAAFR